LRNLATGLVIASAVALAIVILRFGNVLAYSRFALFFQSGDPRFLSLFFFLAPSAALALVTTARTPTQKRASYVFGACILLVALLSGNRSWALFPLLVGAVLWVKLGRRIPLIVALSASAGILLLIPTISMVRNLGTYEQLSLKDFELSQQQSSILDALTEMGSTLNALAVTVQYIPDEEPYRFGQPLYQYLKMAIPNFGLSASLEYDREVLYQRLISDPSADLELQPGDWASWKIIPGSFVAGAGTGFSGIADPYFSFGYAGVCVWFIVLGAFLAKMDMVDIRLNYKWLIFSSLFYWHLLVSCRNTLGIFTKPASLVLCVLAIWIAVRNFLPFGRPNQPGM
jgi:oligosaccharide repeat unit polymerase